jgi:hypothetical protein
VAARFFIDAGGRLTDFRTADRWYAGTRPPVRTPWTTPVDTWMTERGRPIPASGSAVWLFPDTQFAYVRGRFVPGDVAWNVPPGPIDGAPTVERALVDAWRG